MEIDLNNKQNNQMVSETKPNFCLINCHRHRSIIFFNMQKLNTPVFTVTKPQPTSNLPHSQQQNSTQASLKFLLKQRQQAYEQQSYSFYSNLFIRKICIMAQNQSAIRKYNLRALLTAVTKKLLLNELELLFASHLLQQTKWDFNDPVLVRHVEDVKQEPSVYDDVDDEVEFKRLILYLYVVCFTAKYYLNGQDEADIMAYGLINTISHFPEIFQKWTRNRQDSLFRLKPVELNSIFRDLTSKRSDEQDLTDYNSLVEKLLIISPSYKAIEKIVPAAVPEDIPRAEDVLQAEASKQAQPVKKKIKLSLAEQQQPVNSHMNQILQGISYANEEKQASAVMSKQSSSRSRQYQGLFSIPEDYSELSVFRARNYPTRRSQFNSRLNLQRSSFCDYP